MAIYHHEPAADYTATVTGVTNVASITLITTSYIRSLGFITVFGHVLVTPTAAANTTTDFAVSLPMGSNFTATSNASGAGTCNSVNLFRSCYIEADDINDRLSIKFPSATTSPITVSFTATYKLL